jgi:N-acetylglucosamine kinase-like BadF-type ATPase
VTADGAALSLGLDGGGTATRWVLRRADGTILARGAGAGMSGHVFTPEALANARARLAAILADAAAHAAGGRIAAIGAGITGLGAGTTAAAALASQLAELAGVPVGRVKMMGDVEVAYHAAFRPGEGHLVYAGTGSVGCHATAAGELVVVGGRGMLIDDAGSAFWIARNALAHVLRLEDRAPGTGWSTPLGTALAARIGGSAWDVVRAAVYGAERGEIGRLALAVAEAAATGDATATAMLATAGTELARLAEVLAHRFGPRPVALAGGAASLHPAIEEGFAAALSPGLVRVHPALDPAATAARLAAA